MKNYVKIKIFVELQCHQKKIKYKNLINIWCLIKSNTLFMLTWNLNEKNKWMLKNEDLILTDYYSILQIK